MSQSLLYHAFGVWEGYKYRVEKKLLVCPGCGNTTIHRRGGRIRRIRSVPIGLKETMLVVEVPQCYRLFFGVSEFEVKKLPF